MRLIAITSPATDAGKTFIATGLAEGLARRGIKTLFIDLDLRSVIPLGFSVLRTRRDNHFQR